MSNKKPPSLEHVRAKRPTEPANARSATAPATATPKTMPPAASQTVVGQAFFAKQVPPGAAPLVALQAALSQAARWLIEFELLVTQPLHVGSGDDRLLPAEKSKPGQDSDDNDKQGTQRAFCAMLVCDHAGQPSLPGTSLKGVLLARLGASHDALPSWAQAVFGCTIPNPKQDEHPNKPGCAEFRRASWVAGQQEAKRRIETRTAINRSTGTVEPGKLFSSDTVQPGAKFSASIVLQRATSQQVAELHALLAGCTSTDPLQIGAHQRAGWGAVAVQDLQVQVLTNEALASWWQEGTQPGAAVLPSARFCPVAAEALPKPPQPSRQPSLLKLPLSLAFDGPFAVRDSEYRQPKSGDANTQPRERNGGPLLPATSLLGSLRSRAEYILRTLGKDTPAGHEAPGVRTGQLPADLCSLLFGCTGWRGLVGASGDFVDTQKLVQMAQHMVALCRITGGGQDGAKFQFKCYASPTLASHLTLDRQRLMDPRLSPEQRDAALGLLHLLLLDLAEGDIGFGMARSKGWGWVQRSDVLLSDAERCWWQPLAVAPVAAQAGRLVAALHARLGLDNGPADSPLAAEGLAAPAPSLPEGRLPPTLHRGPGKKGGKFHNPYHFLPFAKLRGAPSATTDTAEPRSLADEARAAGHAHDRAQPKRLSGRLVVKLRTVTPLFIGASRADGTAKNQPVKVAPYQPVKVEPFLYKEVPAIPGTSLRGMLSGLLEPITGSAMRIIDAEHGLSMRARADKDEVLKPGLVVLAKNQAGEEQLVVRDEDGKLRAITQQALARLYTMADERWRAVGSKLKLDTETDRMSNGGGALPLHILKAQRTGNGGAMKKGKVGLLPAIDWKNKDGTDRDEFVWPRNLDPKTLGSRARLMPRQVIYYRLGPTNQVEELAWSPIYRRIGWAATAQDPGPLTIGRLVALDMPQRLPLGHRPNPSLHAAEWLLGVVEQNVPEDRPARAFASRLSVGIALPARGVVPRLSAWVTLKELSTPKPPSPALYLKRKNSATGPVDKPSLVAQPSHFAFQGTKTYLHAWRENVATATASVKPLDCTGQVKGDAAPWISLKVESRTTPISAEDKAKAVSDRQASVQLIDPDQHFAFTIRFHNLTAEELNQLCAAIEPSPAFEHRLGMGRPIGLGSVKLGIQSLELTDFAHRYRTGLAATTHDVSPRARAVAGMVSLAKADPDLWQALLMLGEPARVQAPVHYPQLAVGAVMSDKNKTVSNGEIENKNFAWWVENDKLHATDRQVLPPLSATSPVVPPPGARR